MNPRDWIKNEFSPLEPLIEKIAEAPFSYQMYQVCVPGLGSTFVLYRFTSMGWMYDRNLNGGLGYHHWMKWFWRNKMPKRVKC